MSPEPALIVCMTHRELPIPHMASASRHCSSCAAEVWIDAELLDEVEREHVVIPMCGECARVPMATRAATLYPGQAERVEAVLGPEARATLERLVRSVNRRWS